MRQGALNMLTRRSVTAVSLGAMGSPICLQARRLSVDPFAAREGRKITKPAEPPKMLKLSTNEKGVTKVELARSPVNSFNLEFMNEISQWMQWLGSDPETKVIVITSAFPNIFCAGLDITELHNPKPERLRSFWRAIQENWIVLNTLPKTTIAAISGNNPAAGCVLAMDCDYRVMARGPKGNQEARKQYRMGLNETQLGFVAPPNVVAQFGYLVGTRQAELLLQLGKLMTAEEALKLGLVDQIVGDGEQAVEVAMQIAETFAAIPEEARLVSREMARQSYVSTLATPEQLDNDIEVAVQRLLKPEVQKTITVYLENLKKRSKK